MTYHTEVFVGIGVTHLRNMATSQHLSMCASDLSVAQALLVLPRAHAAECRQFIKDALVRPAADGRGICGAKAGASGAIAFAA